MPDDPRKTGRPRIYDDAASLRITFSVTPAQRIELKRVAADNHISVSAVIRDAATSYCAEYREQYPHGRKR